MLQDQKMFKGNEEEGKTCTRALFRNHYLLRPHTPSAYAKESQKDAVYVIIICNPHQDGNRAGPGPGKYRRGVPEPAGCAGP